VARWGISLITVQQNPPTQMIGKGKAPQSLNDLKGMRIRAIGGDAAAMKLIGAVPQNMPLTEVYGGMERGLLDAAASVNSSLSAYKLQEVSNWYTTNIAVSLPGGVVLAGTKAMESLPPQYQKLITDSVPAVNEHWMRVDLREDEAAIAAFKAKGLVSVTFQERDLDALRQQVRPIWDAWVEQLDKLGYNGKELLQTLLDGARKGGAS
jgi:TRAP-type C4-dicarboxylate transport system substrate-binding protein